MAPHDRFNVSALAEEVLRNPNPGTRKIALQGLSIYLTYDRIFELVFYISQRDTNPEVRETATELLATMPPRSSDIQ
ncbi:MAG: hypothetical protein ABI970_10580 [Chloroflexota bacterium]|nr:hypothetical protein [Anaerolineae bacterium]